MNECLVIPDINGWTNANNLAAFVTATCRVLPDMTTLVEFQRGELVHLNPNGGWYSTIYNFKVGVFCAKLHVESKLLP